MAFASAVGGPGLAARRVREGLGAVATPDVVVRILHRALHMARIHEVPGGGAELRDFVTRPLNAATRFVLGEEAASAVQAELSPLAARAEAPLVPAPVPRTGRLVVCTRDPLLVAALRRSFGHMELAVAEDVVTLLDAAGESDAPWLLLDMGFPTVHPATLVTVAPDLPAGAQILLWRAEAGTLAHLAPFTDDSDRWRAYEPGAPLASLAVALAG